MELTEISKISHEFTTELQKAEKGQASSLAFIKNSIPSSPLVPVGEIFQVISIGGTIYVQALVRKSNTEIEIISFEQDVIPQFTTEEVFLQFIAEHLDPQVSFLAMNFAYPLLPTFTNGKLDGILEAGRKEHAFTGLVGKQVGQTIEEFIFAKTKKSLTVSIANDTICLLLSGRTQQKSTTEIAAGIIGTGINFALFLNNTTLINLEAGDFKNFSQSKEGTIIDASSINPGINLFEKEISGAYLYKHFNLLAKDYGLSATQLKSTKELSKLAEDKTKLGQLAMNMLSNSSQLAAGAMAGIANYKKTDLTFVMQGSLFWEGYQYKEHIAQILPLLTSHSVSFIKIDHADILGAAKLLA